MSERIEVDESGRLVLRVNWKAFVKIFVILSLAIASYHLPLPGLTEGSRRCLMIFIGAAGFWVTTVIPSYATAIMVVVLSVYALGFPNGPLGLAGKGVSDSYRIFLSPIASPVLVLFFGGFVMAVAAAKHGFDVRLAKALLKPFGTHPKVVLLGVIAITALFSMFMSNTATTAMMIATMTPLFAHFEGRDPFKMALALAIPFAANIGGIGTIIGTPPNAVAASVLGQSGHPISFFSWMAIGVPLAVILLVLLWFILIRVFKPREDHFEVLFPDKTELTWDLVAVVVTFALTVLLWLTEPLHQIPSGVVALLPIMIFSMLGIVTRQDLRKIEWHVLFLIAGGMTLGVAMRQSGLSDVLVNLITSTGLSAMGLLLVLMAFSIVMSNFMSNTSAANLLIPIVISLGVGSPTVGAIGVAFACSMAMSLPISTPPNAIAFATGIVETRDMAKYGSVVSLVGFGLLTVLVFLLEQIYT
jgi:sodium-dependent dicarboxylate transporter 2/3/5